MKFKNLLSSLVAFSLLFGSVTTQAMPMYAAQSSALGVEYRSQEQIKSYYQSRKSTLQNAQITYQKEPSLKEPYDAGVLSGTTLNNALETLNLVRYIAGLNSNITLDSAYSELCQAGTLLNYLNGELSHYPQRPSELSASKYDALYEDGANGASHSNIAWNYGNLSRSILGGWMADEDSSNIARVGHRRWILNPNMRKTGFGATGAYTFMYSFDGSITGSSDPIVWPAQNMPVEYFGYDYPWSFSLGSFQNTTKSDVKVTLEKSDGTTWNFSSSSSDGYFNVDGSGIGGGDCIIFRPDGIDKYRDGDSYSVTIEVSGRTYSYDVDFFALDPVPVTSIESFYDSVEFYMDENMDELWLYIDIEPSNASDKELTFISNDPDVVSVDADGTVHRIGVGETTITVSTNDGSNISIEIPVSVKESYKTPSGPENDIPDSGTITLPGPSDSQDEPDSPAAPDHPTTPDPSDDEDNQEIVLPFDDVVQDINYDGILFVYANGLMTGYEDGNFHPDEPLTRGALATILWREAGSPAVSGSGFADVPEWSYYKTASTWAMQTGVMSGNGTTVKTFDGEEPIRRQDLALILHRRFGSPAPYYDYSEFVSDLDRDNYAFEAINFIGDLGLIDLIITQGNDGLIYNFEGSAPSSRAVIATALYREHMIVYHSDYFTTYSLLSPYAWSK